MTGLFSTPIAQFIAENDYAVISQRLGLVAIVLVIPLMVERELVRAMIARPHGERVRSLNTLIWPLLLAVALILVQRFIDLLG